MRTVFYCVHCERNIVIDVKDAAEARREYEDHVERCLSLPTKKQNREKNDTQVQ